MSTTARPPSRAHVSLGAVDRYLVPLSERRVLRYFIERLFVAHGPRERLLRAVLAAPLGIAARGFLFDGIWQATSAPYHLRPEDAAAAEVEDGRWRRASGLVRELEQSADALDAAGLRPLAPERTIVLRDYEAGSRGRLLVFGFPEGASEPSAVVKLRDPSAPGASLRLERDALQNVRACRALAATVPEPLLYQNTDGAEILVLSSVPGTSAYVEMQNSLRPAGRVGTHFEAAAEWLARFHLAVGSAHGDYWARNLLLRPLPSGGTSVAVVDWEHFSAAGDPLRDLFQFPVTYGLNYPWRRYRRFPAPEAFRRTFLESDGVADHVAAYFRRYCQLTGLERERLRPGLVAYLEERATGTSPGDADTWRACARALAASRRTVLEQ